MLLLALLPIFNLLILSFLFRKKYNCWRQSILSAAIVWGVFITITTEILSLARQLNFTALILFWLGFNISGLFFYFKPNYQKNSDTDIADKNQLSWFLIILIGSIIFFITVIGIIAIVAPPNTWDSMTYHMSRVVHWQQNQSIAHYPTYNLPQLFHPPFAEYAILHLQILTNSDRFANLIQWFSCIGSVIGVSLIAKELGANIKGQLFAAVFAVTIPMGILQASSTQNDYVVSFWIICLAYYVLKTSKIRKKSTFYWLTGASLGLAILTKSSGYLYGFPFMVWYGLIQIKNWGWRGWKPIFITSSVALLLNINHYLRNFDLFGSFIAAPSNFASAYKIEIISFPSIISNILRNLALHIDIIRNLHLQNFITPITGITNKLLIIIHDFLEISMYDPRTTAPSYGGVPGLSFDENIAGNPLHFFIILIILLLFFFNKKLRDNKLLLFYLISSISGFLLICLLLKIQIYQSRHHLGVFLLLASFVGVCLSKFSWQKTANLIAIILIVFSLPWVFQNKFRPIIADDNIFNLTRVEQYFINRKHLEESYVEATNLVLKQQCYDVGLSLGKGITVGNQYWEYPLWILLNNRNLTEDEVMGEGSLFHRERKIRIEHVIPENVSQIKADKYPHNNFNPCAIIAVRSKKEPAISKLKFKEHIYQEIWSKKPVIVLK